MAHLTEEGCAPPAEGLGWWLVEKSGLKEERKERLLTATGGLTSHAAVVARGMNKACVVGATDLSFSGGQACIKQMFGFAPGTVISVVGICSPMPRPSAISASVAAQLVAPTKPSASRPSGTIATPSRCIGRTRPVR